MPHFVEGCVWSNQLKIATIHEEATGQAEEVMKDRLKRCLSSYGLALKFLPEANHMKKMQQKILIEHAEICYYAYSLRHQLKIPPPVFKKFLLTGQKSLKRSGLRKENDKTGITTFYDQAFSAEKLSAGSA